MNFFSLSNKCLKCIDVTAVTSPFSLRVLLYLGSYLSRFLPPIYSDFTTYSNRDYVYILFSDSFRNLDRTLSSGRMTSE